MASRARTFNRFGYPMAELEATFDRVWLLNDVGEMEFTLSIRDRKARQEFLEYGTYILVEHDKLMPWVGVIDPPLDWSGDQAMTFTAYSGEYLFTWRTNEDDEELQGTAGDLFGRIVRIANREEDLGLRPGEIFTGGAVRTETIAEADLLSDIRRIAERSGNDFSVEPAFDDAGRLYLSANWYYQRGVYRPDLVLQEGINLELPAGNLLTEQGRIFNRVIGLGQSAKKNTRLRHVETDEASRVRYRLRVVSRQFENEDAGTLAVNVREELANVAHPEKVFPFYLLDEGNAFSIRIGDIVPVHLYSVGFSRSGGFGVQTLIRIVGLRLEEDNGRCEIFGKEVRL